MNRPPGTPASQPRAASSFSFDRRPSTFAFSVDCPVAAANSAARSGLPQVGLLDSSNYSSLHPGYYVVFSGVYGATTDADTALETVLARGFAGAYVLRVSP